ncbi:MAG: hypothetical protein CMG00_04280 [Candidatus Marinimicrobia bacterium]|nr:hypothetical protein [Candidatus Neomarinimicrobiota bacterium]|tara:strand:- start:3647 stop:4054 length:408 start_codon:yes stop_codon:yes gene_type:complete
MNKYRILNVTMILLLSFGLSTKSDLKNKEIIYKKDDFLELKVNNPKVMYEIDKIKSDYLNEKDAVKDKYQKRIARIKESRNEELKSLRKLYRKRFKQLRKKYPDAFKGLNSEKANQSKVKKNNKNIKKQNNKSKD